MSRQALSRTDGERRARGALLRLLCAVSVWRTVMTRVLPIAGAAAWWTALLCLLPGFLAAALLRFIMFLTETDTLAEAMRACLGRAGAVLLSAVMTALLLVEGVSSVTALITLFTQGVGTRGTQLTLALLTGVVLLFSLHREGLARGAYFLRWGMAAAAIVPAVFLLSDARVDHLFPLYGDGVPSVLEALRAGGSLAWPVALLLTAEPASGQGRLRSAILPVFSAVGAVLLLTLAVPHELLIRQDGLAALLLLPIRYVPNAVRVLGLSVMLLVFFLGIGASVQLASLHLSMPMKRNQAWLPYGVLAAMFLTQAADPALLWAALGCIEPWLLAPLAALVLLGVPIAIIRRKCP